MKIYERVKENKGEKVKIRSKKVFFENVYYGELFCGYIIFANLAINLFRISQKSIENSIGLVIGAFLAIVYFASIIYFFKSPDRFLGTFKKSFKILSKENNYYAYKGLERPISITILFIGSYFANFGISFLILPFLFEVIFLLRR